MTRPTGTDIDDTGIAACIDVARRAAAIAQGKSMEMPGSAIDAAGRRFDGWLLDKTLPLWWTSGADRAGGYHEQLGHDGTAVDMPRRARVQARQVYVYAMAGKLGWAGPWRQAAGHGFDYLLARYRRPDGLFRTLVGARGEAMDDTAMLYDQAFVLLACASLHRADPTDKTPLQVAAALREAIDASMRHDGGGFAEAAGHRFQSNPHMHMLEATLAWAEAGGDRSWEALAGEIVELCLSRFIDPEGGFLREAFGAGWAPAEGDAGRIVEPGHQFEWAWLLERWGRRTGDLRARVAARRLFVSGLKGVDIERGVAVDEMWDDMRIKSPRARLWPQTERLKAGLLLAQTENAAARDAYLDDARMAAAALWSYLQMPVDGLWRDKMREDGSFVEEPAPASSLYHIVAAIAELRSIADPA